MAKKEMQLGIQHAKYRRADGEWRFRDAFPAFEAYGLVEGGEPPPSREPASATPNQKLGDTFGLFQSMLMAGLDRDARKAIESSLQGLGGSGSQRRKQAKRHVLSSAEVILPDDDGRSVPEAQREAYEAFRTGMESVASVVLASILKQVKKDARLYDAPPPTTLEALKDHLILNGVFVHPPSGKPRTCALGFTFGCSWDEEHGLGVRLHNGKATVGGVDEAF
jgi:hypothetical protein